MAAEVFSLYGTIKADNTGAVKALKETAQQGDKTQSKLKTAFSKIGSATVKVGKVIGKSIGVGVAAMSALTIKALNASGELEQQMGGSEAVFAKYAGKMQKTAQTAFSKMGLSTSDYLATANKMGALFKGTGFTIEESANLSAQAMQRAADIASIMGIEVTAAMESVAGAAKGNFTMMDNLGVAMNDTTLQAYALEKGINKSTREMTTQEKVGLAMQMFLEKTAYATGNYTKENKTLAGSLTTVKAALKNFIDGSGSVEDLASAFESATNVIIKNIKNLLPRLISGLEGLCKKLLPQIPGLLESLLPGVVQGAISLVQGAVEILSDLFKTVLNPNVLEELIDGAVTVFNSLVSELPSIMEILVNSLPVLIPKLVDGLISMVTTLLIHLPEIILPLIRALPDIITSIVDSLLGENLQILIDGVVEMVIGLVEALPEITLALLKAVPDIVVKLGDALIRALPILLAAVWKIVQSMVSAGWEYLRGLPETVQKYVESYGKIITKVWDKIKSAVTNTVKTIKTNISTVFGNIKKDITDKLELVKSTVTTVWNKVKTAIETPINKARDTVKSVIDKIKGFFDNLKINFPKIKLPHFKISGSFSLSPPSVPKLAINWYAKAMDNAMVLNSPTIFGVSPAGQLMGGGEAGQEVVAGSNTLMGMIKNAVKTETSGVFEKLISILDPALLQLVANSQKQIVLSNGVLVGQLAPELDAQLGDIVKLKDRGQ